jgi:hypothetical protein
MFLSWFDASEAKEFGVSLANFYLEKNPAVLCSKKDKFVAKKQEELLGNLSQRIVRFKLEHKLNIYKKAQVGNSFKWTLREAGCDPLYVDQLTGWLMHGL